MNPFPLDHPTMALQVYGHTDTGQRRRDNQDNFLVADLTVPAQQGGLLMNPENAQSQVGRCAELAVGPKGVLILVADGMGGAAAGAVASTLAATWIYHEMMEKWVMDRSNAPQQFAARLREAVEETNARIHEEAERTPEYQGMGTTATVLGVLDGFLYLAQVGDSRAYIIRDGAASQLTRDQSFVQQLIDSGTMSEEEAEASAHGNMILQALGTEASVRVDLTYQEARRGDVLVLCSDGLSRMVKKDELADVAERAPDLVTLCGELIALANARGGPDNITVVAVRLDGDGLREPASGDAVGYNVYDVPRA